MSGLADRPDDVDTQRQKDHRIRYQSELSNALKHRASSWYLMVRPVAHHTIYSINAADLHKLTYIHCFGQRLYSQICGRWSLTDAAFFEAHGYVVIQPTDIHNS